MKTTFILFLTIIVVNYTNAQTSVIEWQKSFGGSANDFAKSIQVTSDGGYILAGESSSNNGNITENHGGVDYWVVKLDATGTIQWQKTYGGSNNDYANSIQTTTDGGYIVAGVSNSTDGDVTGNHGSQDYWVLKLDSIGTIQWQKSYGGSNTDVAKSIQTTSDGGYVVVGQSASSNGDVIGNHFSIDYWVIKLDAFGVIQWQNSLGGTNYDVAFSIQLTSDNGYIVAGQSSSTDGDVTGNHGNQDFWIIKLNSTGSIQWQKSIGGTNIDILYDIQTTSDDGYIMTGISNSTDGDATGNIANINFWVVKIDAISNIQWQRSFGGSYTDAAFAIQTTSDGGYIVAGNSASTDGAVIGNHGSYDYWVVKLDDNGTFQWQKSLGGTGDDQAFSIQNTSDGGFILSGHSDSTDGDVSGNHGGYDYWVVKLSPELATTTFEQQTILIYPNPVQDTLNIQISSLVQISKVKIIDIQGKIVLEQTQNTNTINVEKLAKGMYMLETYSLNKKMISKFIKE